MMKETPRCPHDGALLVQHHEEHMRLKGWLSCPTCPFRRQEWPNGKDFPKEEREKTIAAKKAIYKR